MYELSSALRVSLSLQHKARAFAPLAHWTYDRQEHVDAWHQCKMPGPIILICSNIKIMKYNYFFIEIGIYRSRFDTQYIYPANFFFIWQI